ncbi:hypothetical protein [Orbus mooreae]|uniref:hypothetical protein n=1 Tax=Orbus mooreae TaxID=3074107 RepID=UPI00370D4146
MFKKLMVISVSIILLVGCGEKEQVTEDMLLGEWLCKRRVKEYDYNRDASAFNYSERWQGDPVNITYKKENGVMFYFLDGNPFNLYEFEFKIKDIRSSELRDGVIFESYKEYIFISNNEYEVLEIETDINFFTKKE